MSKNSQIKSLICFIGFRKISLLTRTATIIFFSTSYPQLTLFTSAIILNSTDLIAFLCKVRDAFKTYNVKQGETIARQSAQKEISAPNLALCISPHIDERQLCSQTYTLRHSLKTLVLFSYLSEKRFYKLGPRPLVQRHTTK